MAPHKRKRSGKFLVGVCVFGKKRFHLSAILKNGV